MKINKNQAGLTKVQGLMIGTIAIVFIVTLSFVGYRVFFVSQKSAEQTSDDVVTVQEETPAISNKEDLSKAVDQLKSFDTSVKKDETTLEQLVK